MPAGNGKTGFVFGLADWKQLKTFLPLFSVGWYCVPDHLDVGEAVRRRVTVWPASFH